VSMVAAPLKNEADCLVDQLRRNRVANYLDLTRSAYREYEGTSHLPATVSKHQD